MTPLVRGDGGLERWGAAAALLAWVAVGVPVLTGDLVRPPEAWWWPAYLAYGLLLALELLPRTARLAQSSLLLLGVQLLVGMAAFLLDGGYGFSSVFLVINAASAALRLPLWAAGAVVVVQSALMLVARGWRDHGPTEFVPLTEALVFAGFQGFAIATVVVADRERRARAEATALAVELAAAQTRLAEASRNAERLRIARDVHDTIGHGLTALAVNLEVARHVVDGPAAEPVERARRIATDTLTELRGLVSRTREREVDLARALPAVFADAPGLDVDLVVGDDLRLADPARVDAVLRCAQEVLTNTLRHAGATRLWVRVVRTAEGVALSAYDDGRGAVRVEAGHGLTGMRERFEELGGRVAYGAGPGTGFRVDATLPATAGTP